MFCGCGRQRYPRLRRGGARPLVVRIEGDNEDPAALRHWQHQVGALGDHAEIADWRPPDYRAWRLVERRLLNPGSTGGEAWHLALVPEDPRSEEHTSELQSLMRISYAVFCLKKKKNNITRRKKYSND